MRIFTVVAAAEAKVHDKPIDQVHFHEVGALDSILDIAAAAIALDYLKPERIISTPVELGGGFVDCAHGRIPVPAPATVEILTGRPVKTGAVQCETATPTGAAILAAVVDEFTSSPVFTAERVGYGVGTRDTKIPNVLRVYWAETEDDQESVEALMIECTIDDMNPEFYPAVQEQLWAAGVKDLWMTPVMMKKGRPGTLLSVMTTSGQRAAVREILFTQTTTAGVREYEVKQYMLERTFEKVETRYGEVTVKRLMYQGREVSAKPEYEDVRRLAQKHQLPVKVIYEAIGR